MKKQYLIMISVLMISIVTAGIISVSNIDKEITLDKVQKDKLTEMNIVNFKVTDTEIGNDIERCLYKEGAINTCKKFYNKHTTCADGGFILGTGMECSSWIEVEYTNNEIVSILDDWEKERLEEIADVNIKRDITTKEIIGTGETTIK